MTKAIEPVSSTHQQSTPYSQCDGKHGVPDGLSSTQIGVPERMRPELPFSLGSVPGLRASERCEDIDHPRSKMAR
jgi:hypothetical protein